MSRVCRSSSRCCAAAPACRSTHPGEVLLSTIRPPLFPISLDEFNGDVTIHCAKPQFSVGSYTVHSGAVPHNGPMSGYRVERDDLSVTYISDHQQPDDPTTIAESVLELCRGVDLLIHDAQYTPSEFEQKRTWGHCTVEYAVSVAIAANVKRLALFHHDPYHDDDMVEQMAQAAQQCAAAHGIDVFAATEGTSIDLAAA
jgi:phosphoribosyl 1,2-cyclic phosphodiesterase